jgi:hypothetical protein
LQEQSDEVFCIYSAGEHPMKVPEGAMLGDLVSFANARVLNFVKENNVEGKVRFGN